MSNSNSKNNQTDNKSAVTSTVVSKAGEPLLDENSANGNTANQAESTVDFSELQNEVVSSPKSEADASIVADRAAKQKIQTNNFLNIFLSFISYVFHSFTCSSIYFMFIYLFI